jgi:diguanylate cyclase (GGDEF)-like protein
VVANVMILTVAIPMMWSTLDTVDSARLTASLAAVSLFASILVREIDAQQQRLRYQLDHDPLTGLLNRTSLTIRLQEALNAFQGYIAPATLLAVDLDHFKSVNDRFGHDAGDLVLREVARLLRQHFARDGAVFRLGGEEFLVLLTGRDAGAAHECAESLRVTIAETVILQGYPVTVSIGAANLRASDDRESWVRRSDDRLYAAKHGGRNRVVSDVGADTEYLPESTVSPDSGTGDSSDAGKRSDTGFVIS